MYNKRHTPNTQTWLADIKTTTITKQLTFFYKIKHNLVNISLSTKHLIVPCTHTVVHRHSIGGNCLLNWPKLLGLYADDFSRIFYLMRSLHHSAYVPVKQFVYSFKILCFRPLLISFTHKNGGTDCMINMARVRFAQ